MLFNSLQFVYFFVIVVVFYFSIPCKFRWLLLLIASYYFYISWEPGYAVLIGITTLVSYFSALKIHRLKERKSKTKYLILCLLVNLGILIVFKYFNFFADSLGSLLFLFKIQYESPVFKLLLPVGISFYTFQTLGYVIDVSRGKTLPEKHLGRFALFVSFFPQLVAGPIERASDLIPQFKEKHIFKYDRVVNGLQLMLWGFFKKIVVADRLAIIVDSIYDKPEAFSGLALLLATVLFSFQIYYDFSGYCDIALGGARVLGYELSDNFNRPYFSRSIREFWRRWHITLYKWFRDYVYVPLGGSRRSTWRVVLNILVVFAITGLWHGAAWTFVVWGLLHGFYLAFSLLIDPFKKFAGFILRKLSFFVSFVSILTTYLLVLFSWIFFRSDSLSDAVYVVKNIFIEIGSTWDFVLDKAFRVEYLNMIGVDVLEFNIAMVFISFILLVEILQGVHVRFSDFLACRTLIFRWMIPLALVLFIIFFGVYGYSEFIYFQF